MLRRLRIALCRAALGATVVGCAPLPRAPGASAACEPSSAEACRPPHAGDLRVWSYTVDAGPGARELRVRAELPAGVPPVLGVDRYAHPYLVDLRVESDGKARSAPLRGRRWYVPECRDRGCRLDYRYQLGRAAAHIDRFGFAAFRGGALLAPPSTWLIHPKGYAGTDLYRFVVTTAPGESFTSGVFSAPAGAAPGLAFEAPAELLFEAPYSGFGRFTQQSLSLDGGDLRLAVSQGAGLSLPLDALRSWIAKSAELVSEYYGRFPTREVSVMVLPVEGAAIFGMELGNGGASILLFIGQELGADALAADWVMVHELFHLGFPTLERRHLWFAEGLSTYQGPITRTRAGLMTDEELWLGLLHGVPLGLPSAGGDGLDGTSSWGRTYWGGALFCLLADVAIRSRTHNARSLDDAARAIQRAGGDTSARWSIGRTLRVGDRATGGRTLRDLYGEHGARAAPVDLQAFWRRLGVRAAGDGVELDDDAEWAHVRRAISTPRSASARSGARPR